MKYLIIDDEPQARKLIQVYMNDIIGHELVGNCCSVGEALDFINNGKIDFMFLDIQMPVVNGIDFLRSWQQLPLVILTTAYSAHAIESYELNVVDYLLKPISFARLNAAVRKVEERLRAGKKELAGSIFLKVDKELLSVNFMDIMIIEALQNYVRLHLKDKVIVASTTMQSLERQLPGSSFLRVHRSYIISIKHITAVHNEYVQIRGVSIPIGIRYKKVVSSQMKKALLPPYHDK